MFEEAVGAQMAKQFQDRTQQPEGTINIRDKNDPKLGRSKRVVPVASAQQDIDHESQENVPVTFRQVLQL